MSAATGVGILGLGFMGRTHLAAYRLAAQQGRSCKLNAVCDAAPEAIEAALTPAACEGLAEPGAVARFFDVDAFLTAPGVELVSICTHTDTHVELALRALRAGKHVLLEKPVALKSADVRRLASAAASSGRICVPAMCMRFWPGWDWVKQRIDDGRFGAVRSAVFSRLASPPQWSPFYADAERSGAALFDLHIHDADFVRWCFGAPRSVVSSGTPDHLTTLYHFESPAHVVAEGGWDHAPGFAFRMRYVVVFERATAEFDSRLAQPLILTVDGLNLPVALEPWTGWDGEVGHMLDLVAGRTKEPRVTMENAVDVTSLLEAERESLRAGQAVILG